MYERARQAWVEQDEIKIIKRLGDLQQTNRLALKDSPKDRNI